MISHAVTILHLGLPAWFIDLVAALRGRDSSPGGDGLYPGVASTAQQSCQAGKSFRPICNFIDLSVSYRQDVGTMRMIWFVVKRRELWFILISVVGPWRVQPKGHGAYSLGHSRTIPQCLQNCKGARLGHLDRRRFECQEFTTLNATLLNKENSTSLARTGRKLSKLYPQIPRIVSRTLALLERFRQVLLSLKIATFRNVASPQAWTSFEYPGRGDQVGFRSSITPFPHHSQYSKFRWNQEHFTGEQKGHPLPFCLTLPRCRLGP